MGRLGVSHKIIILVAVSVAVFLAGTLFISQAILKRHALRGADELAATILDRTDRQVAQLFSDLEALARALSATKQVLSADPAGMRDIFIAHVLSRKHYLRAIYLGTADGRMYEWGYGEGFVDHTPSFPPGYDPRVRPWYLTALASDGFSVSEPYEYASVNALGITCVLPVRAPDGSFVGVLGMDILLDSLTGILTALEIPKDGRAAILDRSGNVIASQFQAHRALELSLRPFDLAGIAELLAEGRTSFPSLVNGVETHFVSRQMEGFDWTIVVGMPFSSILASTQELLRVVALFELLMMSAMLMAIALITGRLVVSPLNYIVSVIKRKEGGDRSSRVTVRSGDEFGFLGAELNRLFDTVDDYSGNLEAKVRERTEDLLQLQQENTRFRIAEERKRIYRDMHDSIGAKLTNIFFCNGVARDMSKDGPDALREQLDGIENNCLQAVHALKEIIFGMKEDELLAADTAKLLSAGMRQRLKAGGIDFDGRIDGKAALNAAPGELKAELGKVLEELVSNVLKHADAARVRFRFKADGAKFGLSFADDGRGFRVPEPGRAVSGLNNVRYRVEKLGGSVDIHSEPGAGSSFSIVIPSGAAQGGQAGDGASADEGPAAGAERMADAHDGSGAGR
jgi:signal transduction histidine kinase